MNGEKITGYQKIGELRDKDFIFFPKKDSVTGEVKTYKTGSYIVLGSLDNADNGVYYCVGEKSINLFSTMYLRPSCSISQPITSRLVIFVIAPLGISHVYFSFWSLFLSVLFFIVIV